MIFSAIFEENLHLKGVLRVLEFSLEISEIWPENVRFATENLYPNARNFLELSSTKIMLKVPR